MAGASLLALLDDIATIMDDVAVFSKIAAKKTAGVLGDDLALNAQQVSGVSAKRELPVVWAVAKGSAKNKLILVPAALLISVIAPWAITPALMLGGAYLCFEGFEKVYHTFFHSKQAKEAEHQALTKALLKSEAELAAFESNKIKGAIRTDFVLSAEIIVISLGTVQTQPFVTKVFVVAFIAVAITVGVYTLVAAIVKLDDAGLYLLNKNDLPNSKQTLISRIQGAIGGALLSFAPKLMRGLAIVGTLAMFLVGGSILMHGIPGMETLLHDLLAQFDQSSWMGAMGGFVLSSFTHLVTGLIAGGICVGLMSVTSKFLPALNKSNH